MELLVVVVIASIVGAIGFPTMQSWRQNYENQQIKTVLADSYREAKHDYREQSDSYDNLSSVLSSLRTAEPDKTYTTGTVKKNGKIYVSLPNPQQLVLSTYTKYGQLCSISANENSASSEPQPTCSGNTTTSGTPVTPDGAPSLSWVNSGSSPIETTNRATNGSVESNTNGWATSVLSPFVETSGGSISSSSTANDGSTAIKLVVSQAGQGVTYQGWKTKSGNNFDSGQTYMATVWLKGDSGSRVKITAGSTATAASRDDVRVTLTNTWKPYTVVWNQTVNASTNTDNTFAVQTLDGASQNIYIDGLTVSQVTSDLAGGNSGFETAGSPVADWSTGDTLVDSGATLSVFTSGADVGTRSGQVTMNGPDEGVQYTRLTTSNKRFQEGTMYVAQFDARGVTGGENLKVSFGNNTGAGLANETFTLGTTASHGWQSYSIGWTPEQMTDTAGISFKSAGGSNITVQLDDLKVYRVVRTFSLASPGTNLDIGTDPTSAVLGYSYPMDSSTSTQPHFEWEVSGGPARTTTCTLDGSPVVCGGTSWESNTSLSVYSVSNPVTHTFNVTVTNDSGSNSLSRTWRVVPSLPYVSITGASKPANNSTATSQNFQWTTQGQVDSTECQVDGGAWTSCSGATNHAYTTAVPTSDGGTSHTFAVRVTNISGSRTDSYTWQQRPPAPTATATVSSFVASNGTNYPEVVRGDSPVGYWRLGEQAGNVFYDAVSTNDATATSAAGTYTRDAASLLTNNSDGALSSDGSASVINAGNGSAFNTNAMSVEAWVKQTGTTGLQDVAYKSSSYLLRVNAGQPYFFVYLPTAGWQSVAAPSNISTGVTHHLVGTYDGTALLKIYVDGTLANTANISAATGSKTVNVTANPLYFSGSQFSELGINGTMDELALYGSALSASAVSTHYQAGLNGKTATTSLSYTTSGVVTSVDCALASSTWSTNVAYPSCASPLSLPGLRLGNYAATVTANNFSGPGSDTKNFTVIPEAPTVRWTNTPPTTVTANNGAGPANLAWETGGTVTSTVCKLDNVTVGCAQQGPYITGSLSRGAHTFTVQVSNAQGSSSVLSTSWTQVQPTPVINFTGGPSGAVTTTNNTITYTIANDVSSVTCTLNGVSAPCNSTSAAFTSQATCRSYSLVVTAVNSDTSTTATRNWSINCLPAPVITFTGGPSGNVATTSNTVTYTIANPVTTVTCTLNGSSVPCNTTSAAFTGQAQCTNFTLVVTASNADASGNATRTWHVNCPPVSSVSITWPGDTVAGSGTTSYSASNVASCSVYVDWYGWQSCWSTSMGLSGKPWDNSNIGIQLCNADGTDCPSYFHTWNRNGSIVYHGYLDAGTFWDGWSNCSNGNGRVYRAEVYGVAVHTAASAMWLQGTTSYVPNNAWGCVYSWGFTNKGDDIRFAVRRDVFGADLGSDGEQFQVYDPGSGTWIANQVAWNTTAHDANYKWNRVVGANYIGWQTRVVFYGGNVSNYNCNSSGGCGIEFDTIAGVSSPYGDRNQPSNLGVNGQTDR